MSWITTTEALAKLAGLILRSKISYTFDGIPLTASELSFRKKMNLIRAGFDMVLKSDRAHALPPIIQVEPTNVCNLKCPLCPTGSGSLKRPKGYMSKETFQRILDELGDILMAVYFFCFGEPFLNKELPWMIDRCHALNILTLTSTNGHFIQTQDEALRVVDTGLKSMIVALDGSTQEIYEAYRKSGDIERVKRCVTLIEEAKIKRQSPFPYTTVRAVVVRENQGDLHNIESLARDLGVNMFSYKSVGCLPHSEQFKDFEPSEGKFRRFDYDGTERRKRSHIQCPFPFRQPIIFWDGTVVGCEYDHDLERAFGKIGEQDFADLWNSPDALKLRRSIRSGQDGSRFCHYCPFQDRIHGSTELSYREIRP
jgi:MoaA/NifB/PqqE/SkfB family radical SAM enzyme